MRGLMSTSETPLPEAGRAGAAASVCLVSLGCSKNLVDSEVMVGHLSRSGIDLVFDADEADVVIVNTCGFIGDAREESIDTILEYAEWKRRGTGRGLVVTGCLVELHAAQLSKEIPEVDAFLPLSDYSGVPSIVRGVLGQSMEGPCPSGQVETARDITWTPGAQAEADTRPGGASKGADNDLGRALLTPRHTAYLRLGEGCNHVCAFCAIPKIRGKLKSKPIDVLVAEAQALAELGTREVTLIAEDSTDYGKDLAQGYGLGDLLERLGEVAGLEWVRVMYAHPATMDDALIDVMARVPNVVPYIDIPVQHGADAMLRRMRRGTNGQRIRDLVTNLRETIPGIAVRTTILVGFPGETEEDFDELMAMLRDLRFDRLGCFAYSPEEGTEGATLDGAVPEDVAEARRDAVMRLQREILHDSQRRAIGTKVRVLVDGSDGTTAWARRAVDAPETDGQVLIALAEGQDVEAGSFQHVRVTGVAGYDLEAELVDA